MCRRSITTCARRARTSPISTCRTRTVNADRHWLPGEGTIHWHSVFAALKETGATPRLVIEPNANNRQSIRDGADWMIAQGFVR